MCRTAHPKRELLRVVRTPAGAIAVDPTGKLPGRGAYVCDDPACRERAAAPGGLSRALGMTVPPELRPLLAGTTDTTTTHGGASGTK